MNEHPHRTSLPDTTQAAEGLPRRRWSVAEIEAMVAKGIILEDERFELIGGEVVPMSPKGARHETVRTELAFQMTRQSPGTLRVAAEAQFNLTDDTYTVPDLLVYPATIKVPNVRGASALLVVEVADSSLAYDLDTKASLYAAHGVGEYWVIDARTLNTRVHREPAEAGYHDVIEVAANQRLVPKAAPELALTLAELTID
jgi:Uma2 family endonuclease